MNIWISRRYTNQDFNGKPNLGEKILIFEDRVMGWQLEVAETIRRQIEDPANTGTPIQYADIALLSILFSYFEMIAQCMEGRDSEGQSKAFFAKGLEDVFPQKFTEREKGLVYQRIRCGMYHRGLTKKGALINGDYPEAIQLDGDLVKVNPRLLSSQVKAHFEMFIGRLKSPNNAPERCRFERMYDRTPKV